MWRHGSIWRPRPELAPAGVHYSCPSAARGTRTPAAVAFCTATRSAPERGLFPPRPFSTTSLPALRARPRSVSERGSVTNRKLLVLLGPVVGVVMFVAAVKMASGSYRPPTAAPAATASVQEAAGQKPAAEAKPAPKPYEEAQYRTFPVVGSRVAIWVVAQLHLLFAAFVLAVPDLRVHRRGDRLQDRRHALRPARPRVHEAALGLVLAHRDVRRVPDVHAHHPVSEVHELPDERVLADVSALRRCCSSSRPSSSTPTTTAGGSSIRWCISASGSASTSSARRSCSSPTPG